MTTERRRLVREESVRPRAARIGRLERAPREGREEEATDDDRVEARRRRRGRPPLREEVADLNRGAAFVGIEGAAVALDVLSRVLRRAVDRAFDEDYDRPGDVVRGVTRDVDDAAYDLVSELRGVPRKLSRRFDDALRSPRADRGERERLSERETSPADSPAANGEGQSRRLQRERERR